ncbi:glycoside hydrolase family 32 protein [Muricomes sp. OA1]|uniref:Sucrose-6-phosphate hydrolase n=1 Tax=Hungatella hathewayi TaxID=154046 RepID=A0A3E2WW32_9FIRM|nr:MULTISPECIES: glycoside hydrolase family 32 protein [Clostridia]MEE0202092.1 glycoside hydrolase family 32 protein [Muricomes sp.]MCH1975151.1 glycoside hydrolase family 32 protein [Muricomes sp. OA1]MRM90929.1 sucrose-6-phosphate hydrolase [Faecalicatena contorta]RGC32062.1 glycosyl hydrolase family 32 [Hungatella hathewayi]GKH33983.1 sucrose-6-phosphate hydrolase [Faecalicatena contorta]
MLEMNWSDKWRLGLHLMPPTGWLNDPNGLCQFQGVYHVFFQYSPDNPEGGSKCWGHYTSTDLLEWQYAGIALSPEAEFDRNGVYSGSALASEGVMHLFYTGNVKLEGDYNYITDGRQSNTVLSSSEDGLNFDGKKCLMTNDDYPDHLTCHIRDPKVVTGKSIGIEDDNYYMFLGARTKDDRGEVLVYKSPDLESWEHTNILTGEKRFGYMWECPDAFMLGEKKILSVSPQGVETRGIDYQNVYQSGYFELDGSFDGEYRLKNFREWDRGFDFYAPQTFLDEQGRRLLIGWIGMPDDQEQCNPTVNDGWQNALTVPREVFLKDEKVMQYPAEELLSLRKEEQILEPGKTSDKMQYYDIEITMLEDTDLTLVISDGITLCYSRSDKMFTITFLQEQNLGYGRKSRAVYLDECRSVRILADTTCLEVYLNGGEEVFTTRFYTEDGMSSFRAEKGDMEIKYWVMEPMKVKL